jgi:spermidine synthase
VWRALEPGPVLFGLTQFALVGITLLLPTAAMGATLPLLARFATLRLGAAGERVGTLYAVNTAGAVAGTILCGFVLLPEIGREATTYVAAASNLLLGIGAIALDRWSRSSEHHVADDDLPIGAADAPSVGMLPVVTFAIGLAGFSALVYEVAWTRVLGLMLGGSTYTFSVMLVAFLLGIAIGGRAGGPLADRWFASGGVRRVLLAFAAIEVGIALVSYALMYVYPELPFLYVRLYDAFAMSENPRTMFVVSLVVAGLVMTVPAVLMGMHFPLAVRAVVGHDGALGGPVGLVYGANTLGGVFGAFLAGFVLLPSIRVQGTVFVAACAELAAAAVLVWAATRGADRRLLGATALGLAGLALLFGARRPPWDPMLMTAGMYHYASHFDDHSREGILNFTMSYDLLFYEEGLSSVVTAARSTDTENMWLANNGKVDASTTSDMPTQVLCSLLPVQFVDDPRDVLVIGLASGITAGAISLVPDVKRLDVVELEPAIRRAARLFDEWNHHVLDDERLNLVQNDGRNHVLLTPAETYDVIVSEPSNPWISGVSNLFTRDFLEIGKTRLKPGGVWSQWVQMYGMDSTDLRILLRTFAEVYPHVVVFATIEDADLVLVGSESPLVPTEASALRLLGWPQVRRELKNVGIRGPYDLLSLYQFDRDAIVAMSEGVPLNTDDNMIIEYHAPLNLHVDTSYENFELLLENARIPEEGIGDDPDQWAKLARSYHERSDQVRATTAIAKALAALPKDDPRRARFRHEAERWKRELEEAATSDSTDDG